MPPGRKRSLCCNTLSKLPWTMKSTLTRAQLRNTFAASYTVWFRLHWSGGDEHTEQITFFESIMNKSPPHLLCPLGTR